MSCEAPNAGQNQSMSYTFDAELWRWTGQGGWMFVTVPADVSQEIREETEGQRRGFGSVRVVVTVGESTWSTSVFPDSKAGLFVLPIKAPIRKKEDLLEGDVFAVTLQLAEVETGRT